MRFLLCALFLLGCVPLAAVGQPKDPPKDVPKAREKALESKDDGKVFGEAAWKRVAPAAEKLQKEKGIDFVVETFATPPKDADKVKAMKPAEREKFFKDFAEARAKELKLKGVYILVCKTPTNMDVIYGPKADFPFDVGAKIRSTLFASFKESKFDEGLNKAIDMTLEAKGLGEKK